MFPSKHCQHHWSIFSSSVTGAYMGVLGRVHLSSCASQPPQPQTNWEYHSRTHIHTHPLAQPTWIETELPTRLLWFTYRLSWTPDECSRCAKIVYCAKTTLRSLSLHTIVPQRSLSSSNDGGDFHFFHNTLRRRHLPRLGLHNWAPLNCVWVLSANMRTAAAVAVKSLENYPSRGPPSQSSDWIAH